jgi:hypothetical protein
MAFLLSVDSGLKTGMVLYGRDGRPIWYRSQIYSSVQRLKSAVYGIFNERADITALVVEGGVSGFNYLNKKPDYEILTLKPTPNRLL